MFVQKVIGTFLYYGRAVNPTILAPLSAIASDQAAPTENTLKQTHQFLDYAATHPDAVLMYKASNMVLAVHSNASYLNEKTHAAEQAAISFSETTQKTQRTMELSTIYHKF